MRWFAAALISATLVLGSCARAPEPDLNPLAERYVRLSLEIGSHEEGYIDAYFGDPAWRTQAEANPRDRAALKAEMDTLHAELVAAQEQARDPEVQRRARTLAAYVASGRFRLDMMDGTRVPFVEEAERLFALRPRLRPLESYDAALAQIETLVPGRGRLAERVDAFWNRYVIPADRVQAVMEAAIAECRRRTAAHMTLPEGERFEMELVRDQPWGAYNWYRGDNHSLIQINTDLPSRIGSAIGYGCHEGYPGHHVQGMNAERLYRDRGWVEYSVMPLFSPQGPLNEGGGNYGVDLAFPGDEALVFERDVLFPLAGLDPTMAAAYKQMTDAMDALRGATLTIDQMYLDGEIDRARFIELTQRYGLVSRERAEQSLEFVEAYRSYVINYSTGEDVVRAFVERAGRDQETRWRAYESILTQPTLPQDLMQ